MQFSSVLVSALLAAVPALAFTNGSLVPSYICGKANDGYPKSFGQLLGYTREEVAAISFSPDVNQNQNNTPQYMNNNTMVANSAYILAAFHNALNTIEAIPQQITVKTANGGPIQAGKANPLILQTAMAGVNIDGVLIYAENAWGEREGSFKDTSGMGNFVDFPGCGVNKQGQFAGVIHQQVISENDTYSQLVFNAPQCVKGGNLTMAGLSVTDGGFGVWKYEVQVVGSDCTAVFDEEIIVIIEEAVKSTTRDMSGKIVEDTTIVIVPRDEQGSELAEA